ncbi:hypothetical protein R5R35_004488 [Gryllus longicercus]|uniref:Uncharacterized protein n=1 Tax=Gryllus longicercus TaxID=2509291 RepID=A0AAN9Z9C3_9ORTH
MDEGVLPATRVNGAFLPNFTGKRIVVIASVMKIHPSGRSMEVKTSDDRVITVNFNRPLIDSVKGLVEIHGVGSGKNVMTGEFFFEFPEEISETFGKFFLLH